MRSAPFLFATFTNATFLFATFTNAIKQAALQLFQLKTDVYIDDWFLTNRTKELLSVDQKRFVEFLMALGVTIQHEKTEGPANCITYLGLLIDTINHEIRLPEAKRIKYLESLEDLLSTSQPKMAQLVKAASRLVHISSVH